MNGVTFQEIHDGTQKSISILSKTIALAKKLPYFSVDEYKTLEEAETFLENLKTSFDTLVNENRERKRREKQELFDKSTRLISIFTSLFPNSFPIEKSQIRPLAIGIHDQILAVLDIDHYLLGQALRHWCNTTAYLYAVKNGAERINLDGSGTQTAPTREQQEQAFQRIKRRFK